MRSECLSSLVSILESGSRPKGGVQEGSEGVLSLGAEHLDGMGGFNFGKSKRIPDEYFSQMKKGRVACDDILVVKDGATTGKTSFVGPAFPSEPAAVNEHVFIVRVDPARANPAYVFRYLASPQGQLQMLSDFRGATVGGISRRFMDRVTIPLPPLPEQRRIAAILDKADGICRKRRQTLDLADQFIRSAFLDMFGDPVTNPKGWPVKKLGDVGALDRGRSQHRPRNDAILLGGSYPLIQTGDVANSGGVIQSYTQTYSEVGLKQSRLWKAGTLCITIAANIANTAVLAFDACFPDSVVGFAPGSRVTTEFVQGWFSFLQPILELRAPQVAQKNINLRILRGLEIPIPPIELQDHYLKALRKIRRQRELLSRHKTTLDQLCLSVVQRAFRGEL